MKTRTLILRTSGLLASGLLASIVLAGPGPDYWRNLGKTADPKIDAPSPATIPVRACIDARVVTVTETKPGWHNGRGPLVTTEVGRKLTCTACDTPVIVMKPSGPNARGAMAPVAIPGTHDCTKAGCGTAKPVR